MDARRKTVLLVDDEPLFLTSLEDVLLAELGPSLDVLRAEDGLQALELLAREAVDVLVTDLRMPRLDGIELMIQLTQIPKFVPTIVVTAHGTPKIESIASSLGALAFVEKPVDVSRIVDLIRERLALPVGGTMGGVSLPGFLQLLAMERKSCVLRAVSDLRSGVVVFVHGVIADAHLGPVRGDEAVLAMCQWEHPTMHVEPILGAVQETVTLSVEQLLLESARLADESDWKQLGTAELPIAATVLEQLSSTPPPMREPSSRAYPDGEAPITPTGEPMSDVSEALASAMKMEGAIAAALVDFESGLTLGVAGGGEDFDIEAAAAGNTQVVRAKLSVMRSLGIGGAIEDILITLRDQYHLIRPLESIGTLFLYVAIDRERGNLGLARHKLSSIEKSLEI